MKPSIKYLVILLFSLLGVVAGVNTLAAGKEEKSVKTALDANLAKARPGLQAATVYPSGAPDLYEVTLESGEVVYTTGDGKYMIAGRDFSLYRLDAGRMVDVREERLAPLRTSVLAKIPLNETINFSPVTGRSKAVVHVFTDVDCGYCQKLHSHMTEYNALGIEIRYLAFPRAGANSVSAKKLINAWCADDKQDALTKLKANQKIPEKSCDNPVAAQYALGQQVGVSGTPALIAPDGRIIGGYLPPQQLAKELGL